MEYRYLIEKDIREELKKSAYNICEFIRKHDIPTIVALDKSGRPAGLLVSQVFKQLYPDEKQPKVFFLNPGHHSYKTKPETIPLEAKNLSLSEYTSKHPDEPVIILDEYSLSGRTIERAKDILESSITGKIYSATLGAYDKPGLRLLRKLSRKKGIIGNLDKKLGKFFGDKLWEGPSGVREYQGRSFPQYDSDEEKVIKLKTPGYLTRRERARQLRQELKYLAEEIKQEQGDKPKKALERLVASALLVIGLGFLGHQDSYLTGNIINSSSLIYSDTGFFIAIITIIIGGVLFIRSFKD